VTPILDAGLVELVDTDHRICDELDLTPTVGHTPGHIGVRIVARSEEALITGDFMHHPWRIACPEWDTTADIQEYAL
jgi:glyoxylase-like metal-dependent hydrolase (beta-lactamase superfamily II)